MQKILAVDHAIADGLGEDPIDAFVRLLVADPTSSIVGHAMREDDVEAILGDPRVFVASDASATAPDGPGGDHPVHPREYGTFPRALALARDRALLPLEAVVRKMTSLPAERFGLRDRGVLRAGVRRPVLSRSGRGPDVDLRGLTCVPLGIELVVVNGTVA
jgi:N-acyl-D-amino-acid deacylase